MKILRSARWLVLAALLSLVPASSYAGVFISVGFAPPVLPVYVQPECPEPGLMWSPGYWAYGDDGYYWVPGAWVPAPYEGALWTPPYWGFEENVYMFHPGYWGRHVGYYGGVNYGFGYMGIGFVGGEWHGRDFAYNTAVVNVNRTVIRNTYVNETIVHNTTIINNNHVAYSGGPGGIRHEPTNEERVAMHETHTAPTPIQQQHFQAARMDHANYFKANNGRPQNVAVARPLAPSQHSAPAAAAGNPGGRPNYNSQAGGTHGNSTPVPAGRVEGRPAPPARQDARPAPVGRQDARPAYQTTPQSHPAPTPAQRPEAQPRYQPAPQSHPAPQPRYEQPQSRPAPQPHNEQARPAPRPEPQSHPAPPPRQESRPAPESKPREPHR